MYKFQSTPPRRRRPRRYEGRKRNKYFNPRLREGGDLGLCVPLLQHPDFNPRLREGGDAFLIVDWLARLYFNPRLREGGDAMTPIYYWRQGDFNPRLREGGDFHLLWMGKRKWMISIHASEKEATATYCDTSTIMYISSLNNFFVRYF